MVDLSDDTALPETPYEHKVCMLTLIAALGFMATCAYYFLTPDRSELAMTAVMATGGLFILVLLNFFIAAFSGKLCGQKKN